MSYGDFFFLAKKKKKKREQILIFLCVLLPFYNIHIAFIHVLTSKLSRWVTNTN